MISANMSVPGNTRKKIINYGQILHFYWSNVELYKVVGPIACQLGLVVETVPCQLVSNVETISCQMGSAVKTINANWV